MPIQALTWWARRGLAARHGRSDGLRQIPEANGAAAPAYLHELAALGRRETGRLGVGWCRLDERLHAVYAAAAARYHEALERLGEARAEERAAQERYRQKPTRAARLAQARLTAGRRRHERAAHARLLALHRAISARTARFRRAGQQAQVAAAQIRRLMQRYAAANVRARDGHDQPPGLQAAAFPVVPLPDVLQDLVWDPALDEALAGRTARRGPPAAGAPAPRALEG